MMWLVAADCTPPPCPVMIRNTLAHPVSARVFFYSGVPVSSVGFGSRARRALSNAVAYRRTALRSSAISS